MLQLFWKNSIGLLEDRELLGDAHRTNHNTYFYNWYLQSLLYARHPAYLCAQEKPDHLITIPHWVDGDGGGITEKVKEVEGNPGSISKERRALRRRILRSCQYCHMTLRVWAFLNFAPHPLLLPVVILFWEGGRSSGRWGQIGCTLVGRGSHRVLRVLQKMLISSQWDGKSLRVLKKQTAWPV